MGRRKNPQVWPVLLNSSHVQSHEESLWAEVSWVFPLLPSRASWFSSTIAGDCFGFIFAFVVLCVVAWILWILQVILCKRSEVCPACIYSWSGVSACPCSCFLKCWSHSEWAVSVLPKGLGIVNFYGCSTGFTAPALGSLNKTQRRDLPEFWSHSGAKGQCWHKVQEPLSWRRVMLLAWWLLEPSHWLNGDFVYIPFYLYTELVENLRAEQLLWIHHDIQTSSLDA